MAARGQEPMQFMGNTGSCTTFLKLPHGEDVTYLFSATQYGKTDVSWNANFEFCAMYFPQTQTLRFAEYDLARAVDGLEEEEMQSVEHWTWRISQSVNERVGQKIANDRDNLSIQTLSEAENIRRLRDFEEWGAEERAADVFLSGKAPDTEVEFFYNLQDFPKAYKEDALIEYFRDADCQRRIKIVRKRRGNFVVLRRQG